MIKDLERINGLIALAEASVRFPQLKFLSDAALAELLAMAPKAAPSPAPITTVDPEPELPNLRRL